MKNFQETRRDFLKGAVASGTMAASSAVPLAAPAQTKAPAAPAAADAPAGYVFLTLTEAAFIEAAVEHMFPADDKTPGGVDLGINIFIDRALAGPWGKGDRLYMDGPWQVGVPSQGYQLPLTPAQLFRQGMASANTACQKQYGKSFDQLRAEQKEEVLQGLAAASWSLTTACRRRLSSMHCIMCRKACSAIPFTAATRTRPAGS
jgi:gluconate 2-dehydrogenase gamma chain